MTETEIKLHNTLDNICNMLSILAEGISDEYTVYFFRSQMKKARENLEEAMKEVKHR